MAVRVVEVLEVVEVRVPHRHRALMQTAAVDFLQQGLLRIAVVVQPGQAALDRQLAKHPVGVPELLVVILQLSHQPVAAKRQLAGRRGGGLCVIPHLHNGFDGP